MLEINRNSEYTYRINPDNARLIDRRENKHNARWREFRLLPSAGEANAVLLRLESKSANGGDDAN